MTVHHGTFAWYDLMTTDTEAAIAFYGKVIGWTAQDSGLPDRQYFVLSADGAGMGGLMALPPEAVAMGARPGWMGYILADDVDASAAAVVAAGGAIHRPAEDIPGVGRFAVVADPQGAIFNLFRGMTDDVPAASVSMSPGRVGWNEHYSKDQEASFAFYAGLFGWSKSRAIDMGPMGTYQLFSIGGVDSGGMMANPAVPPCWGFYFAVPALDAALARVSEAGGQLIHGPMEVPGGAWVAQCIDPQGAHFAMVAGQR